MSPAYEVFFQKHFVPVAKQMFRYNMLCGFVPWTIIKLNNGQRVPKILPIGTFSWEVQTVDQTNKTKARTDTHYNGSTQKSANIYTEKQTFLQYVVESITPIGLEHSNIIVTTITEPSISMTDKQHNAPNKLFGSLRFEAANLLFSPLVSVAYSYMRLERGLHRRSYADDWNTTARIVTSNNPPRMNTDAPDMGMLDGLAGANEAGMGNSLGSYTYDNMQLRFSPYDTKVENILTKNNGGSSQHCPSVYTLPQHYKIEKMDHLTPIEDPVQLCVDYQRAVAQISGIPLALVQNFDKNAGLSAGEDPMLMDKLMMQVCQRIAVQMETMLTEMYTHTYGPSVTTPSHVTPLSVRFNFSRLVDPEPVTEAAGPKKRKTNQ
jgi:hypothetical protein